ncbi:dipeptidase 1 [Arthroderma uncinatum]|uniref:dipeptidase 1 n=1 Tax=Arthroderma uncinatum TaxID=74035 RepID=UPI00144AD882|nr:dipeptidase 1 [Arthroderma uncinatum]KAF3490829.1 dipeptidase 1 [Arthroderma uncinatum]
MAPESRSVLANAGLFVSLLALTSLVPVQAAVTSSTPDYAKRAERILKGTPLIDGHNDLPFAIRRSTNDQIYNGKVPFETALKGHTDLPRMRKGQMGGQFWSVFIPCPSDPNAPINFPTYATRDTLEQIDLARRLVDKYSKDLMFCDNPGCAKRAFRQGKIGSFIGIEGGHQVGNSIAALRQAFYAGARYMTITHNCDNAWATAASTVRAGKPDLGMTEFGSQLVKEMNRLGMLVDLSHVSHQTMRDVLKIAQAPVIFSHSSSYEVSKHLRNVPDDVLKTVAKNNGVVMVTFVRTFVNVTDPDSVNIDTIVKHIFHIAEVAGWDHVGLGGDYDGTSELPKGLEDVSKYPDLIAKVLENGATDAQVRKLVGENVLRVWTEVEQISKKIQRSGALPVEEIWEGRNGTLAKRSASTFIPMEGPAPYEFGCD